MLSFVIITTSNIPYIRQILRGKGDSSVAGWGLSSITGLAIAVLYDGAGAEGNVWAGIVELVEPLLITTALLWVRTKWGHPERSEVVSAVVCALCLFAYGFFRSEGMAEAGLVVCLIADIACGYHIVVFAWREPGKEQPMPWLWGHIGVWISLFSFSEYTWDQLTLVVYQLVFGALMMYPTFRHRIRQGTSVKALFRELW